MKIISRHIHRTFEREKDTRRTEEEEKGSGTYLVNIWIVPNTWNIGLHVEREGLRTTVYISRYWIQECYMSIFRDQEEMKR